ncbi:3-methyl-2-oxobutanoate dehydrogenase subunit beta [Oscillibacter sp. GMB15532]|uniref:3-methyl-2-oxobutanoate dehydrogenase subunit beta n=1 Tax=Oscillibacter sp. GMB15532 TaxID=3230022 RepID=UPI0034E019B9
MARVLIKGNEVIAEAALRADVDAFFGYPITPQNEVPEYLARELPKKGKVFLQSESELAGINMVLGASAAGARVMTSSSGPGLCLMLEAISSMALTRLPAVIIDVMRSGPGAGDLAPAQEDWKLSGNGAYKIPILLPGNVQELANMVYEAFDIADQYGTPVLVLADGMLGQMMEPVDFEKLPLRRTNLPDKPWRMASVSEKGYRTQMQLTFGKPLTEFTDRFENETMPEIKKNETRYEAFGLEDADIVVAAYGTAARMAKAAIKELHTDKKIGFIRPMTAWPFPEEPFRQIGKSCKAVICPEINTIGQMIDDVRIAVNGRMPVYHVGNTKTGPLNTENVVRALEAYLKEEVK